MNSPRSTRSEASPWPSEDQVLTERLLAVLAEVSAGLAVLLAWIGLYAVMSDITSGRLREIGIRWRSAPARSQSFG
ncbi:MAG: hypothetical protein ACM4AI_11055 [Acidobacteriota bacterium]